MTLVSPEAAAIASIMTMNEAPIISRPKENFAVVLGFLPRRESATQIQAKTGARAMMYSGLSDWNQLDGKSKPNSVDEVLSCAKMFSVEPDWS